MKHKDVTPKAFACAGGCCPSVFETDKGTYLIIGTKAVLADSLLSSRIGPNETVIEVPAELLRKVESR